MIHRHFAYLAIIYMLMISCAPKQTLRTKIYPIAQKDFVYPEAKQLSNKKNIGIAFSGGGSRSAALTTGQLRALNKLGLLDSVKYISSVSGGGWASVCYSYSKSDDQALLGKYISSDSLKMDDLKVPNGGLLRCVADGMVFKKYYRGAVDGRGDEIFSSILNRIYLDSLGIGANKFPTYNQQSLEAILEQNRDSQNFGSDDFYIMNPNANRPFLIVNGTVVGQIGHTRHLQSLHYEMTPLYSGIAYADNSGKGFIGGGYIDTFAVDYSFNRNDSSYALVECRNDLKQKFTLSDMMAITGNAPGTFLYRQPILKNIGLKNIGLPEIKIWSPLTALNSSHPRDVDTREVPMADGGNLENLGLIPLLKRKVDKIIVFANSKAAINATNDSISVDGAIRRLFGEEAGGFYSIATNLLSNKKGELQELKKALLNLHNSDQPVIYTARYIVNDNPYYGISVTPEWNSVEITWVYNDNFARQYFGRLDPEIQDYYLEGNLDAAGAKFPHLPTILTTYSGRAIDYTSEAANMLANFSSWIIVDNRKIFEDIIRN